MLRLLALSLLALAAPHAIAEQVPFCQMVLKRMEMVESEQDLEQVLELMKSAKAHDLHPDVAEALRGLEEALRETDPGTAVRRVKEWYRYKRTPKPRYYVPLPLSRELLNGAVNPCDSAHASCPPRLERLYDWLSEARRRGDQSRLEMYQRSLRYYYRSLRYYYDDYRPGYANPCDSAHASCPPELDRIYDGLSEARRRDDQSRLEMYQRSLRYYYRTYQP